MNNSAAIAKSQGFDLSTVEVNDEIYNPKTGHIDVVVAINGRWVKMAAGNSVSRADAIRSKVEWFEDVLQLHPEWLENTNAGIVPEKYRARYIRTKSVNGNASMSCGDSVAKLMQGLSVGRAEALASFAVGEPKSWPHLNAGQRVMNARNAVRRALKDGFVTIEDLSAALTGE